MNLIFLKRKRIVFLLLFLLTAAVFSPALFVKGKVLTPIAGDDLSAFYYSAWVMNSKVSQWGVLLWNPYRLCGEPWFANPQNPFFYPFCFFFLVFFSPPAGVNFFFAFHVFLAGCGMYLFAKSLRIGQWGSFVSALAYMFTPMVFLRCYAGHFNTIAVFSYIPFIFFFFRMCRSRRLLKYAFFCGIALGFQILAGNTQFTYYTVFALCLYAVYSAVLDIFNPASTEFIRTSALEFSVGRRGFLKEKCLSILFFYFKILTVIFVFSGLLAAVKLIPNFELAACSTRAGKDLGFVGSWSLPPENLLTILFPEIFGKIVGYGYFGQYLYWEMCCYVGIFVLFLALVGANSKKSLFFVMLAILSIVSALSSHTPLFKFYVTFLPGFTLFRGHNKFLVLYIFSASILCGFGCRILTKKNKAFYEKKVFRCAGLFFLLGNIAFYLRTQICNQQNYFLQDLLKMYLFGFVPQADRLPALICLYESFANFIILAFICTVIFFFYARGKISRFIFKGLVTGCVLAELLFFGVKYIKINDVGLLAWDRDVVVFLKKQVRPFRVHSFSVTAGFEHNNASLDEIEHFSGYEVLKTKMTNAYLSSVKAFYSNGTIYLKNKAFLDAANVKYIVISKEFKLDGYEKIFQGRRGAVYNNENCLPRAFIVLNPDKKNEKGIFFDTVSVLKEQFTDNKAEVCVYSPHEIILEAKLKAEGFLVLGDVFYPGWKVFVKKDNAGGFIERPIIPANRLFRAVYLEPGSYKVKFVFRPLTFFLGVTISFVSLISCLILVALRGKRRI